MILHRKTVQVALSGGLGNQMFQYAMGRALALRMGARLILDISFFNSTKAKPAHSTWRLPFFPHIHADAISAVPVTPSPFTIRCLRRIERVLEKIGYGSPSLVPQEVREPRPLEYWEGVEQLSGSVHLHGYWQHEKYFRHAADQIRKDFAFPALPAEAQEVANRIRNSANAVSVHIRRGDYISNPAALATIGVAPQEYYARALDHLRSMAGRVHLFVFSDEPEWVRSNFDSRGHEMEVAGLNLAEEPHHDMHLMALCRHHILANSSFSWWGAWLGTTEGFTIAPRRWVVKEGINTDSFCPALWIRL